MPFPSPGDLPNSGIKPGSSASQADSLPSVPLGKPIFMCMYLFIHMYMNACVSYIHTSFCVYIHMDTCIHIQSSNHLILFFSWSYMHTSSCVYIHMDTCIYIQSFNHLILLFSWCVSLSESSCSCICFTPCLFPSAVRPRGRALPVGSPLRRSIWSLSLASSFLTPWEGPPLPGPPVTHLSADLPKAYPRAGFSAELTPSSNPEFLYPSGVTLRKPSPSVRLTLGPSSSPKPALPATGWSSGPHARPSHALRVPLFLHLFPSPNPLNSDHEMSWSPALSPPVA